MKLSFYNYINYFGYNRFQSYFFKVFIIIFILKMSDNIQPFQTLNNINDISYSIKFSKDYRDSHKSEKFQDRITDIFNCDFFIGLGSGLSWLAWALDRKVILISSFSAPYSEFYTPYRILILFFVILDMLDGKN